MQNYINLSFITLILILSYGKIRSQQIESNWGNFKIISTGEAKIVLKNTSPTKIHWDEEVFADRGFVIEVPHKIKKVESLISEYFLHTISYSQNQQIILIRLNKNIPIPLEFLGQKQNLFIEKLKENKLTFLQDRFKFKTKRFFGIYSYPDDKYYSIYLNVKERNIEKFNSSISNLKFD
jgi:hypothetical protein